ncbi:type II toxin-antitoxin system prevent-host-death family antitoxin [Streptomyces sp. NPDC050095]|uniref:type II toxin-antitoxin system Phd/YefM family antitoxin n=1 Tax=unclassified Streptomyces TaxID=2593676 RepID=UPI00342E34F7
MATRVPIGQLQQHAGELIDRVAAGEFVEVTRNGRLIAVLRPPGPEQQALENPVRSRIPGAPSKLSDVLRRMREETDPAD